MSTDHGRPAGRPEIGPAIKLRFPPEILALVDAQAAKAGTTRAALIRRYVAAGAIAEASKV